MKTSYETEKRYVKRCKELSGEILHNATKVQIAMKHFHDDKESINSLKKEIENSWQMVENAKGREEQRKHFLQELKNETLRLQKLIETDIGSTSIVLDRQLKECQARKEELIKSRDESFSIVQRMLEKQGVQGEELRKLEVKKDLVKDEISSLQTSINKAKADHDTEERRRKKTEQELENIKQKIEEKHRELEQKNKVLREVTDELNEQASIVEKVEEQKFTATKQLKEKEFENY